jgi:hypothetical protein
LIISKQYIIGIEFKDLNILSPGHGSVFLQGLQTVSYRLGAARKQTMDLEREPEPVLYDGSNKAVQLTDVGRYFPEDAFGFFYNPNSLRMILTFLGWACRISVSDFLSEGQCSF